MPVTTLGPQKFRKFLYSTPKSLRIELRIDADSAIDIFVVEKRDIDPWRAGKDYGGAAFLRRRHLAVKIPLESNFDDYWYLVLENVGDKATSVQFDVWDA